MFQFQSLDFRQKFVITLVAITLLFITFCGDIFSTSNGKVRLSLNNSLSSNRSKTRAQYPEIDNVTFPIKLNPFKGTTTTTTAVYKEIRDNETCVVPDLGLEEKDLSYSVKPPDPKCSNSRYIEVKDSGEVTIAKSAPPNAICCLKVNVKAPPDPKDKNKKTGFVETCDKVFRTVITKVNLDFFELNCTNLGESMINRTEFHARFKAKAGAHYKKKAWDAYLKDKKLKAPPSVLILGLSSMSNRQAKKFLLKTNKLLLKELGFLAYNQYLKSGETVAENLFQMLTGTNVVKILDSTNSSSKVAKGTIVNDFNRLKYVSFKIVQEFFYLYKVPFSTDYTVNSLVDAYHFGMAKEHHSCFQHNLLQEIFSFSTKVLSEYKFVPSFGTIWLDLFTKSIPGEAFPTADKVLHSFFTKNKKNLENTIVIMVSDEGTHNHTDFEGQGYTRNNFPFLYIHYPKHLRHKTENQNVPISAKDIYSTLQGVLVEGCSKVLKNPTPFPEDTAKLCRNLAIPDTSVALWTNIKAERNFKTLGISENVWQIGCNAGSMTSSSTLSAQTLEYASQYLLHYLNQVIDTFFTDKVKVNCDYWVLEIDPVSFSSILRAGTIKKNGTIYSRQDVLLVIKVQPDRPNPPLGQLITEFEAVVRIDKSEDDLVMSVLGFPRRVPQPQEFPDKYNKCVFGERHIKVSTVCFCRTKPQFNYRHVKGAITDY